MVKTVPPAGFKWVFDEPRLRRSIQNWYGDDTSAMAEEVALRTPSLRNMSVYWSLAEFVITEEPL